MEPRTRATVWSVGLTGLLVAVVLVSATIGPVRVALPAVATATLNAVGVPTGVTLASGAVALFGATVSVPVPDLSYTYLFSFPVESTDETIVRGIRLPRIVLGATVGFALAAAGTVMQGFFRNPMADPSIIGVSSGAAVGAVAPEETPMIDGSAIGFRKNPCITVPAAASAKPTVAPRTMRGSRIPRTIVSSVLSTGNEKR